MDTSKELILLIRSEFRKAKELADKAIAQVSDEQLYVKPEEESNNIAIIIRHITGNLISRFTDFYTSDGEKPDRNRDSEFEDIRLSRKELLDRWDKAWNIVFTLTDSLIAEDLLRTVHIRKEPHTAMKAFMRQISHYNYHVGQIVLLAKMLKGSSWKTLSIPKGGSQAYNDSK
jgi:hypothetical protein